MGVGSAQNIPYLDAMMITETGECFLFEEHSMERRLKLTKTDHVDGSRKPGQLRTFKLPLLVYVRTTLPVPQFHLN